MDLSTTLGGLELSTCIYNASGCRCTLLDELNVLLDSPYAACALSKTNTWSSRNGNPSPRYWESNGYSSLTTINSMGIPNLGYETYRDFALKRLGTSVTQPKLTSKSESEPEPKLKPLFLSIGGLTVDENLDMLRDLEKHDPQATAVQSVELNVSCPNIVGKPQLGYDMEQLEEILRKVTEIESASSKRVLGLKLPPYFDFAHFDQTAEVLTQFTPQLKYITCSNSLGNGLVIDSWSETAVIKPKGGFGGIGGVPMKPVALANVRKFYELIGDQLDIVGCGGVEKGVDVFDLLLCGAKAVQVGSSFQKRGIDCFQTLTAELDVWCKIKKYSTIDDFRGKLNQL